MYIHSRSEKFEIYRNNYASSVELNIDGQNGTVVYVDGHTYGQSYVSSKKTKDEMYENDNFGVLCWRVMTHESWVTVEVNEVKVENVMLNLDLIKNCNLQRDQTFTNFIFPRYCYS